MRRPTVKSLKNKLWELVSQYVRQRDKGLCFTCNKQYDWRATDAGHFLHEAKTSAINYDERLLRCQCTGCNRWKHGNLGEYTEKMIEMYGLEQVKEWKKQAKVVKKWKIEELQSLIDHYKSRLKDV